MPNRLSMFRRIHARMSWASLNVGAPRSVFQAESVYTPPGHGEGIDIKIWSHGLYKCAVIVRIQKIPPSIQILFSLLTFFFFLFLYFNSVSFYLRVTSIDLTRTIISCGPRCTNRSLKSPSSSPRTSTASSDAWGIRAGASRARRPRCSSRKPTTCDSTACPTGRKIWFWCAPRRYCTFALPVRILPFPALGACGVPTVPASKNNGTLDGSALCFAALPECYSGGSFILDGCSLYGHQYSTVMPRCFVLCMLNRPLNDKKWHARLHYHYSDISTCVSYTNGDLPVQFVPDFSFSVWLFVFRFFETSTTMWCGSLSD
jgi:hypothetical protein